MKKWWPAVFAILGSALAQQPVTIQYWHINTETFGLPAVKELIAEFQRENPGIRVEERFNQNSYTGLLQNLQAALAANNPPDVAQIGYLYTRYVAENFPFVPITDLIGKFGGTLSRFPANVLGLGQVGGAQLGMPYSLSNIVTYYNADAFKKAGLNPDKPPTTWSEWRAAAQQLKKPIYIQLLDDNWSLEALIASNGGNLLSCQNGNAVPAFASQEAIEALQFWADLVKDGLAINALWNQGEQVFLAGEAAAYMTTIAKRAGLQAASQGKFELRGTRFPSFGNKPTRLPAGGNVLMVFSKDPAKQAAAWKFIQFLTSEKGFTIWTKGTGYVPLLPKLVDDPRYLKDFVAQNPIQRVGVEQLPNVFPWTSFPGPNGLAASQALFKATQRALSGQVSARVALNDAAQEVGGLIKGENCVK
ncbi:MAG: ABC transporter substrate-binding protein [Meiothermus sp.]